MSTDIKTVDNTLPAHLANDQSSGEGLEGMVKHIRPPYAAVVERQTKKEIRARYEEGSAYCSDGTLLCEPGKCFTFIPLVFYADYWKCNVYGVDPFIIDRTTNSASELARKCEEPKYWNVTENGIELNYSKVFQFVCLIEGRDIPVSISFRRGRMADGQNNLQKFALRKKNDGQTANIYDNVFECWPVACSKKNNEYYSFEFRNPSKVPQWVQDPELHAKVKQMHLSLKAAVIDETLEVQGDSGSDTGTTVRTEI